MSADGKIFSIVIPAYNEEKSVQDILGRCLAAAEKLKSAGLGVSDVEVLLVNDGSTDKTEEFALSVQGVRVLTHARNRGYGAAIKTGFAQAKGHLLGFLDADGTCDPEFFGNLIGLAVKDGLDVAVGSRMHPDSRMPPVRIVGNWAFRTLVNVIGSSSVTDIASGMRVVRRAALQRIYPLPNGLNFTPAMSVRAILDRRIRIGEIPMPYRERVGRSKLSVVRDGLRFLGIILDTSVTYRPRFFFWTAACAAVLAALWALTFSWGAPSTPLGHYLRYERLEDWMIFRIILVTWCLSVAAFLGAAGVAAQSLADVVNGEDPRNYGGWFLAAGALSWAASLFFSRRLLSSYFSTGTIPNDYWVFPLVGTLFALIGVEFIAFALMARMARLLRERDRERSLAEYQVESGIR